MLRPHPLRLGAPIAVIAPASAPRSLDRYRKGLARLHSLFDVRMAWAPGGERGYLAGPDTSRIEALHAAFRDPSIRAVFCVRGGYGSLRLLDRIDWTRARNRSTLLVGYSDITALHLAFYAQAGWTSVSGPVVTEWAVADETTLGPFLTLAAGGTPSITNSTNSSPSPLRPGTASGPLLGGNLSVLVHLLGTPYAPDFRGAILVLEDVAEAPYRIDRMLNHLKQAGVLDSVSGVVLGHFSTGDTDPTKPSLSLSEVFADYFGSAPYPVLKGLPYGHLLPRCSLPIGVPVRLKVSEQESHLTPLAPVVAP